MNHREGGTAALLMVLDTSLPTLECLHMKRPLLWLIRVYQRTLARALPEGTCRFYPSCSHYGYEAIEKYGAIKGSAMAAWRVMRCNPWSKGGFDPVQ